MLSVRGDDADPFSGGYICPKGTAMGDLHHDPDRLRLPLVRTGDTWTEVGWDEALDVVATRLLDIRARHGRDALAVYLGNPAVHNLGLLTYGLLLTRTLATRNAYSATSVDQLPHMLAALLMFGNQLLMPVPDIDRTDLFICLGANPLASNGSIMTAPDVRRRLQAVRARGGQVIVLDPRRTETAAKADRHLFLRPGTDAVLLLALIHTVHAEGLVRLGAVPATGLAEVTAAAASWSPERAAAITGVPAADIRGLARALATTPRAVLYGRLGVCAQEFGGLAAWLCYALNALTGHLDTPGGLMFTTPAVDPIPLAKALGVEGGFARWHSRVSGKPEFGGELPVSVLAEEIETTADEAPGAQVRALLTIAGNPVLSTPGGARLERALPGLELMVAIDPYLNETTRHAHVILPPTSLLERSHYDVALNAFAVRNVAKYAPPTFERGPDQRHDWEICLGLVTRLGLPGGPLGEALLGGGRLVDQVLGQVLGPAAGHSLGHTIGQLLGGVGRVLGRAVDRVGGHLGPEAVLDLALRTGPRGAGRGGLSLAKLREAPHGLDLGALAPRLPGRLHTRDRKVHLAPAPYLADLPRLARRFAAPPVDELVVIGRRDLRSNNSWMHNTPRLVKGPPRCTLLIHPDDAAPRGLVDGARARVTTPTGAIELPVELTTDVMPGVVSIPHGWGHGRPGTRLTVASTVAGVSLNDILDPTRVDELSGTSALTGQPVEISLA